MFPVLLQSAQNVGIVKVCLNLQQHRAKSCPPEYLARDRALLLVRNQGDGSVSPKLIHQSPHLWPLHEETMRRRLAASRGELCPGKSCGHPDLGHP